jgi:soluble lytic murein transglycosylase
VAGKNGSVVIAAALFAITCGRTTPAPPQPQPEPAPPAITEPALPTTVEEARPLKTSDPERYERALKAIATPRSLALLGISQFEQKRWDDAIATLTSVADAWPSVAPFLRLRIATAEQQRGNVANAINVEQQVIATQTSAANIARLRLPALYAQAGDAASTDEAFKQIASMQLDELSEGEFVDLAAKLESAGRPDLATAIRMRLLRDYPQGRFTEKTFDQVQAALDALSLDETTTLASRLAQQDHYDEALQLLERAATRFPEATKSAMYRTVKLRSLFNSRHYSELLADTAKNQLDATQLLLRARAAWRAGDSTTFLAGLDEIEKKFPQSREAIEAKLQRAKYFSTDEIKYDAAIENLQQAIGAGAIGNEGETLWTLGWTYVQAGKDDDALQIFDQYLHQFLDGDYRTNSLFWAGKIYEKRGLMSERDTRFRQLIAEYPYSYYAYRAKEIAGPSPGLRPPSPAAAGEGLGVRAFPELTSPDLPLINDLVSIDLMRDATREMKLAVAAHPDDLGYAFKLADLYIQAGEPFKANGVLQRRFRDFVRHGGANIPDRFWQILFPLNHWETIKGEAAKRGVDPYLLASIIRQESGFEPSTISNAGAVGLMQIMPAEAEEIAARAGIEGVTREKLFDPDVNIAVGAAEFAQKLAAMQGRSALAIAAYNGGESNVNNWLTRTPAEDLDFFIEAIPYAETRLYVKTVTRNRNEYRRIYER